MNTTIAPLVEVRCKNPHCRYLLSQGKRMLVGRISDRGELKCPSCRRVDFYKV